MKKISLLTSLLLACLLHFNALAGELEELEAAAQSGKPDAMFAIGSFGLGEHDYPKAFKWLSKGAAADHAPSQAALGFMYFNGFACDKDISMARKLYEQSAAGKAHQGYNNLAHLYRYGLGGLEKDLLKTKDLLEKAAKLGNEKAVNTLAHMYVGDELGPPDLDKALQWFRYGAERNYRGCLSDLGFAYQHGIGVEKNPLKAVELYQKSINQGYDGAKSNLGYLYLMGEDLPQDYPKAMQLFEEASAKNDIGGTINLAVMHFNGLGCDRNPSTAFTLLEKAEKLGSEEAGKLLKTWKDQEATRTK